MTMSERDFEKQAEACLVRLESALGELDPDDCDATLSMGVLSLEFADGSQFKINSHRAARQIWMAANLRAWHFDYDPENDRWVDSKTSAELFPLVEELVSEKVGYPVKV